MFLHALMAFASSAGTVVGGPEPKKRASKSEPLSSCLRSVGPPEHVSKSLPLVFFNDYSISSVSIEENDGVATLAVGDLDPSKSIDLRDPFGTSVPVSLFRDREAPLYRLTPSSSSRDECVLTDHSGSLGSPSFEQSFGLGSEFLMRMADDVRDDCIFQSTDVCGTRMASGVREVDPSNSVRSEMFVRMAGGFDDSASPSSFAGVAMPSTLGSSLHYAGSSDSTNACSAEDADWFQKDNHMPVPQFEKRSHSVAKDWLPL